MTKSRYLGFQNTPSLWNEQLNDVHQFEMTNLDLSSLQLGDIPSNLRLGHQMEHVFKELITHVDQYDLLLHNLPIRSDKSTLGEIDFILKDRGTRKLIHVELAYKFYIIDPEIPDPIHRLIGPNRKDRFYDKLQKIKHKQMPLLHTPEGAKALSALDINHEEIAHQCCFKAQLFYPHDDSSIDIGNLNTACMAGAWLRLDDFSGDDFTSDQYYIPTKSEWVIEPNDHVDWKNYDDIVIDIAGLLNQKRAPMLWRKRAVNEYDKLFVVWW